MEAWQSWKLPDEVRLLGGGLLKTNLSSECAGFAHEPAKLVGPTLRVGARSIPGEDA
jgi:hypothetical protein